MFIGKREQIDPCVPWMYNSVVYEEDKTYLSLNASIMRTKYCKPFSLTDFKALLDFEDRFRYGLSFIVIVDKKTKSLRITVQDHPRLSLKDIRRLKADKEYYDDWIAESCEHIRRLILAYIGIDYRELDPKEVFRIIDVSPLP